VGDFREGILMTRFFSHVILERDGSGALEPLDEPARPLATDREA
jgi:hypothetical protein